MCQLKNVVAVMLLLLVCATSVLAVGGGDVTFKPGGVEQVVFSHDYHMKNRGIKCSACHFPTFSSDGSGYHIKKEKLNKRDFCGHCHNGMKGFDLASDKNCKRCHTK